MPGLSDKTKRLVDHYKEVEDTSSHRHRARMEQSIWDSLTPTERKKAGGGACRESWLAEHLGDTTYAYRHRHTLIRGGVGSDELWHRIENEKMPLGTAVRLLSKARKHAQRYHCTVTVAMNYVLKNYDELDASNMSGGVVKRKKARRKTMWGTIEEAVEQYAKDKLTSIDPVAAKRLMDGLQRDLKVLIDSWQSRLTRYKRTERDMEVAEISRRDVIDACSSLSMDPPPPNQPVDLKKARKQQRQLARLYHPDSHGGDETMRPKFEAVNDAYALLTSYNESLDENTPTLTVINGGK